MKLRALRCWPFAIPYQTPYATARGTSAVRYGVLVSLSANGGVEGLGEASPYPGPGEQEAQRAIADALRGVASALEGCPMEQAPVVLDRELARVSPAVASAARAGFDIALWDLRARAAGVPVAALACDRPRESVLVNALIADPTVDGACAAAREARGAGFRAVKLKVGMAGSPEAERARIVAVREELGESVALRLDANGAWDAARAIAVLRDVAACGVEYVEQPVPPGDLDGMRAVRETTGVRVAADEAVTDAGAARRVLEADAADVLIVKPLVLGGIAPSLEVIRLALERGASVVVTTTVDAGVGVAAALHLAAALPEGSPAQGLATAHLLASDLLAGPLPVDRGEMRLPAGPGLGVTLDREALERYAVHLEEAPA
ncbi:MAG TPA: mandelate racemase/muconate lactonizing enzyme family protein [Dehalococcoidia bacterium]|nr:mandelate racemase/muconate lactonizing enzyme family protein [Dehalococcoidia bacterium]